MSDVADLALIALSLPLISAVIAFGLSWGKFGKFAHVPTIGTFGAAAILALVILGKLHGSEGETLSKSASLGEWFSAGSFKVQFAITVDPLSAIMIATVTFVATWIAIFSSGYMHDDPGYGRFFAVMSLFVFSMGLLVLANDFIVLVGGWEGVGVCSYLLVGYYYAKPSAAAAARKALLVTRLGDAGMILGIFLLWQIGGFHTDFEGLFTHIAEHPETHGRLTVACLLLFCGAIGKSAQLPLYVWLPDAMEGPTPVSALIHAATMVTAGVYLLARCAPLFVLSPNAQITVCLVGGFTAFLAAFIAVAQNDLKRVLAYSTVSQLGFMFMALGTGGVVTPGLAVTAAIFHLFTHAFFKALLFLGSGSVMHAMGGVIDIRRFGGLKKILPFTHITFLAGCAALAGLPLLSGFWSKDQILDVLKVSSERSVPNQLGYIFVYFLALVTAGMTAFYTFRAYFLTFHGPERIPQEAGHHAHESPWSMLLPLVVLAVGAVFAGIAVEPFNHTFSELLGKTPEIKLANEMVHGPSHVHPHFDWLVAGISSVIALTGVAVAWKLYGHGGPETVRSELRSLHSLSQNKVYVDEIYMAFVVKPAEVAATASRQFDQFVDSLTRLIAFLPRMIGAMVRPFQNGMVQFYALSMVVLLTAFLAVLVLRAAH